MKPRFLLVYPVTVAVLWSHHFSTQSFEVGMVFVILGMSLRSLANGYAVKMAKLTTSGPYAYVRHPLYLGSLLIAVGFLVLLQVPVSWGMVLGFIGVGVAYMFTLRKENRLLGQHFGEAFSDYRRAVPALIPTLKPYGGGERWGWSINRYFKSQEYKLLFWVPNVIILLYLKEEILVLGNSWNISTVSLLILGAVLGLLDLVAEIYRKKWEKDGQVHSPFSFLQKKTSLKV